MLSFITAQYLKKKKNINKKANSYINTKKERYNENQTRHKQTWKIVIANKKEKLAFIKETNITNNEMII